MDKIFTFVKNSNSASSFVEKIQLLMGCVEQLSKLKGKRIVVKCGGAQLSNNSILKSICFDIALLTHFGAKVAIVHGAGKVIPDTVKQMQIRNADSLSEEKALEFSEMVYCGKIAPNIVTMLSQFGASSVAISGRDSRMIVAERLRRVKRDKGSNVERIIDMGMIGEPVALNHDFLTSIMDAGMIPVISPIGTPVNSTEGAYMMSADTVASFIAAEIQVHQLIMLVDKDGLTKIDGMHVSNIDVETAFKLWKEGIFLEEDNDRLEGIIASIRTGTGSALIANGLMPHPILADLLGTDLQHCTHIQKA